MRKYFTLTILAIFCLGMATAQKSTVDGYVFETDNRGFLREVKITVYTTSNAVKAETMSNAEGFFTFEVSPGEDYKIKATKSIFEETFATIKAAELTSGGKVYVKMEMPRKPGYLFDVTLADSFFGMDGLKNAVDSTTIEIYNNTTNEEVLVLEKHPFPGFTYTFEQGNHYTVMVRKDGYFTKRMEAHVNIDGCILCFEGMGNVRPSDNLTEGNTMGSLLANVELDKIRLSQGIKIENIYYDYNKADIRQDAATELDKIVVMMKDNPNLIIELGSHTDSRGQDEYNLELSERRAKSAVAYIMREGGIPTDRIAARGYGESSIANRCTNGIACSDKEHEQNRRTMIKVVGFTEDDPLNDKSLREIIYDENMEKATYDDFESYEYVEGGELPDEIKKDLERQRIREEEKIKAAQAAKNNTAVAIEEKVIPTTPTQPKVVEKPVAKVVEKPVAKVVEKPEPVIAKVKKSKANPQNVGNTVAEKSKKVSKKKEKKNAKKEEEFIASTRVEIRPKKSQLKKPKTTRKDSNEDIVMADDFSEKGGNVEKKKGLFGEEVKNPKKKMPVEKARTKPVLKAKQIAPDFSGYMIEFFNSSIELSENHSIFKQYGKVKMEETSTGEFAYLISGFETEKEAKSFLEKVISLKFPAAKVVQFANGKRME
jgi:outer membrane protein OmpA-like peptidoglycan-associated protein